MPSEFRFFEESENFWDTHSTADYWDELEDVDFQLSPSLKAKLERKRLHQLLGFSTEQIAEIEVKAKQENVDSKELIRRWIWNMSKKRIRVNIISLESAVSHVL